MGFQYSAEYEYEHLLKGKKWTQVINVQDTHYATWFNVHDSH